MPVDQRGGNGLSDQLERRARLDVSVTQAGHVAGMAHEVGDAVGVEAEEIGLDEELGGGTRVGFGHTE